MIAIAILFAALVVLPAIGMWLWSRFILTQLEGGLRAVGGFEPRHFEIGPQADCNAPRSR